MKILYILISSVFFSINVIAQLQPSAPVSGNQNGNTTKSPTTVLYSQMEVNVNGYGGIASQEFPDFSDCRLQSADDFSVPAGGWTIGAVDASGVYYNGIGAADSFIIEIYADDAGSPDATPLYAQSGLNYNGVSDQLP